MHMHPYVILLAEALLGTCITSSRLFEPIIGIRNSFSLSDNLSMMLVGLTSVVPAGQRPIVWCLGNIRDRHWCRAGEMQVYMAHRSDGVDKMALSSHIFRLDSSVVDYLSASKVVMIVCKRNLCCVIRQRRFFSSARMPA